MIGGRFIGKFSYRGIMLVSITFILISLVFLGTISIESERGIVTLYMILMGLGLGASFPIISTSALQNVDFKMRGSANSMNTFFRTIGSAIGITIFGTLQSHHLKNSLETIVPVELAQKVGDGRGLLQVEVSKLFTQDVYQSMLSALADSISFVYQWSVIVGGLALLIIVFMGGSKMEIPAGTKRKKA